MRMNHQDYRDSKSFVPQQASQAELPFLKGFEAVADFQQGLDQSKLLDNLRNGVGSDVEDGSRCSGFSKV